MDPYVILTCRSKEQRSTVAKGTHPSDHHRLLSHGLVPPSYRRFIISSYQLFVVYISGAGSDPEWNETFFFAVSGNTAQLHVKIMDSDVFSADDLIGEARQFPTHTHIPIFCSLELFSIVFLHKVVR
jgi:hypothetical protein